MAQEEEILGKAYDSRLMKRLLTYLRPYRWQVALALISIIFKACADILGPYLIKVVIDRYLAPAKGAPSLLGSHLSSKPLTGVAEIGAIYVGLLLLQFVLEYVQIYFMQWTGQLVMFDLRSQLFRHLQRMHIAFYDKNPVGRLVTRVTTDVDALNEMFTSGVVAIFEDIFVLAGIMGFMLSMNWRLALITFAVLPLIAIVTKMFRDSVRDSYRRIRIAIARINAHMQEHVSGMMVLQLFNRERRAFRKFSEVNESHMEAYKDAIFAYALYYPVVELLSSIAIACVIWFGGTDVLRKVQAFTVSLGFSGHFPVLHAVQAVTTIGILVAFMQYAQRFFRPIQDLSEKYNILQGAMAAAERVFKLLDTPVEVTSSATSKTPTGPGRIVFDHVWFAYRAMPTVGDEKPGAQKSSKHISSHATPAPASAETEMDWVLRDVSFTIEPGETVAIVGHTGAGKTTIISLLTRLYDVQRGSITIDGVDIKQMDLSDLRRRFGVVLQDPFLFSGTVEGNIRLGSSWISHEDIVKAIEDVNLSDFIQTLPNGLQQEVNERGSTLSTGQKQLISFARALAHDPKILILDEATSSVDTETEFKVRDALSRMVQGRTSVIIAHRLSTIQQASKIIVMHKGHVREMGTHQQLLAQRGIYYKLYQLQYKDQEISTTHFIPPVTPEVAARGDD